MKKICKKISTIVLIICLTIPLAACSFNIYFKAAVTTIINDYANQTSSLVKALILSKEIKTDTSQTINDALATSKNISINNPSNNASLNNWDELAKLWGYNEKIEIKGFNPSDYFVKTGDGQRTKQVNSYKSMNDVFSKLNLILGINLVDNRKLYNLYKDTADVKNLVTNFLNLAKEKNPNKIPKNSKVIITLLKNLILGPKWKEEIYDEHAFENTIIKPLDSLLDYLIDVQWTKDKKTPIDASELKEFMSNWNDEEGNPYSQWTTKNKWGLTTSWYKNWESEHYNFYRAGTLINYTFFKIGKDYQISNPEDKIYKKRYLGEILSDHISLLGGGIKKQELLADLAQYLPHLLENPQYILLLAQAIIPILKKWVIKMNVSTNLENLSFGKGRSDNSYNIGDIFDNINNLLNSPEELKHVLESLVGLDDKEPAHAFTYDIKLKVSLLEKPLPELYNSSFIGGIIKNAIKDLIGNLTNTITSNTNIKNAIRTVINIYNQWSNQEINKGYIISLKALKNFLTATEGILTVVNKELIPVLTNIILNDKKPVDDEDYFALYEALGGVKPEQEGQEAPINFRTDSLIYILKKKINEIDEPLSQIIFILLGNSNEKTNGVFKYIVDSNNAWIYDNYKQYFANSKYFKITDAAIPEIENGKLQSLDNLEKASKFSLTYKFIYTINNRKYHFYISCISINENNEDKNFTGTKHFYFKKIKLTKIEEIN